MTENINNDPRRSMSKAKEIQANRQGGFISINTKIKLINMLLQGASSHDIEVKTGLLSQQISVIKNELGVSTFQDAKCALVQLEKEKEKLREIVRKQNKTFTEIEKHRKNAERPDEKPEPVIKNKNIKNLGEYQNNRRIAKIYEQAEATEDRDWNIPEEDESQFLRQMHLGVSFWATKYNVPTAVIWREIIRLRPNIDLDHVPS